MADSIHTIAEDTRALADWLAKVADRFPDAHYRTWGDDTILVSEHAKPTGIRCHAGTVRSYEDFAGRRVYTTEVIDVGVLFDELRRKNPSAYAAAVSLVR